MLERVARTALVLLLTSAAALADAPSQVPPPALPEEQPEPSGSQVFVKDTHGSVELVQFTGNLVFNDFTYRALLQLPKNAGPNARTARAVVLQLTRFLHAAGYDLARVEAEPGRDAIHVAIDEGHLQRVVIVGESAVNTIRLRLQLQQPFDVFNRPELEARLRALSTRMGLTDASYQLVRSKEQPEQLPRLFQDTEALEELREAGLLAEPGEYELHIAIGQGTWGKGFSPEVVIGGLDGLGLGGVFHGSRLLPIDDRWEARIRGGVTTLPTLDGKGSQFVLSRALAELHYWSAPLWGQAFRPGLLLSSDLLEQSRPDINYNLFRRETLQGALGVGDTLSPRVFIAAGAGAQARWFFDLDEPDPAHPPLVPVVARQIRPLILSTVRFTLDPTELRTDFRSPASLTAKVFFDQGMTSYRLDAAIDYATPIGWHELRWDAHAFAIGGQTQFYDEEPLSDFMQGEFNDVFTKHIVEIGGEFRYSLIGDQLKVGVLAHLLIYGEPNPTPGLPEYAASAASIGLGLHSLMFDAINVDADLSIGKRNGACSTPGLDTTGAGCRSNSAFGGPAFSLNLSQVY